MNIYYCIKQKTLKIKKYKTKKFNDYFIKNYILKFILYYDHAL